ncbi:hypothetical protein FB451DRAFT_1171743 [Mycena latifolia]|nr:hypothetical protein FB451DRAFT_1171743 [Mycena latifolia]
MNGAPWSGWIETTGDALLILRCGLTLHVIGACSSAGARLYRTRTPGESLSPSRTEKVLLHTPSSHSTIYDDLEKLDNGFAIIGQQLKDSKEFWEGVDRKLNSAPYTLAGQNIKDPPDGSRTESVAQKIQTGLETVHGAAQQYSGSPKILKAGTRLVRRASALTKECTTISSTQSSVEVHLQQPNCNPKSGRKAVSPLGKGFGSLVRSYETLSQEFTKWAHWIYLLFWFAGSTPADKLRMERPDHVAHAVLLSKGLPSYLLPFESSLTAIERHLRGIQKLWMNLELMGDGIPRPAW